MHLGWMDVAKVEKIESSPNDRVVESFYLYPFSPPFLLSILGKSIHFFSLFKQQISFLLLYNGLSIIKRSKVFIKRVGLEKCIFSIL